MAKAVPLVFARLCSTFPRLHGAAAAAPPEFLGLLRKLLDPRIKSKVIEEINKDYTQLNAQQLREQIDALH